MKCTGNKVKMFTVTFWLSALLFIAFTTPIFLIPVALLAMFSFAYLMLSRVPLPIVLSFVCMVSLSLYTVYMNTSALS